MAIRVPDDEVFGKLQIEADDPETLLNNMSSALETVGWTRVRIYGSCIGTFTGVPTNGQTISLGGVTYTFVTSLSGANQVLIGGSADACATNLRHAINDESANEGSTYGTGTNANTNVSADTSGATITFTWIGAGSEHGQSVTEGLVTFSVSPSSFSGMGYWLIPARTPQGLQVKFSARRIVTDSPAHVRLRISSMDEQDQSTDNANIRINAVAGRVFSLIACKHQMFACIDGVGQQDGSNVIMTVPWVRPDHAPRVISSIANSSGEIEITTSVSHGWASGQYIYIDLSTMTTGSPPLTEYSSAINGLWQITVTGATTAVLNGSTYPGTGYDANSGVAADETRISRLGFLGGDVSDWTLRVFIGWWSRAAYLFNQYKVTATSSGPHMQLNLPVASSSLAVVTAWGSIGQTLEAQVIMPATGEGGTNYIMGELWGAVLNTDAAPKDQTHSNYEGFNWICYTDNYTAKGCLWLIYGQA